VPESLLALGDVTSHLRILGQSYVGVREIPISRVVGSVDRAVDFDRLFKPRARGDLRKRLKSLREAFPDGAMPPISVYEASGLYFVSDGHHRVALARADGAEFIDAEVTALRLSHEITADVDVLTLVHTELRRQFMEQTALADSHPEADIVFSRPSGYWELRDLIEARAFEISTRAGSLMPMPDAAADWYDTCWVAAQKAIDNTDMRRQRSFNTPGDLYLWVHYKLRELKTYDRKADWIDAARCRASERITQEHRDIAAERRNPLPKAGS
jgi:hypothetical protein